MKVLHLFANWKWTGPAEPAVRLATELARFHQVLFAAGRSPFRDQPDFVLRAAREAGLATWDGLHLRKHFEPLALLADRGRLARRLIAEEVDLLHCHLPGDHLLAALASRRAARLGLRPPLLVRSVYGEADLDRRLRSRFLLRRATDAVVAATEHAAAAAAPHVPRRVPIEVVPVAVDVERFAPDRLAERRESGRRRLGLAPGDVAFGVVARVQPHRRFDLLLQAFGRVAAHSDRVRLVVLGRGTRYRELLDVPVARLGLEEVVVRAGFQEGAAYDEAIAALDAALFLVPGSDGSCRAARELLAAGLPLLVTQRPPLPEIVRAGETGMVLPEDPEAFATGVLELAGDEALRRRMGRRAREDAERRFSGGEQARRVSLLYDRLLAGRGAGEEGGRCGS